MQKFRITVFASAFLFAGVSMRAAPINTLQSEFPAFLSALSALPTNVPKADFTRLDDSLASVLRTFTTQFTSAAAADPPAAKDPPVVRQNDSEGGGENHGEHGSPGGGADDPTGVPEPSTMGLAGLGLAGAALLARKRLNG